MMLPEWEAPAELSPAALMPAFPVDRLPVWIRDFVAGAATTTQTPLDLPAMLALAVIATLAAGRVRIQVRPDWEEPVNIYVAVVLPPGERKSAVFEMVRAPLNEFERAQLQHCLPEIGELRTRRAMLETAAERARKQAASKIGAARDSAMEQLQDLNRELDSVTVPAPPRLVADDVTPEAVTSLLAEQAGRIAILSSEGGIFELMAGRYNEGRSNLDVYLKGHTGDEIRVDRKGRPPEQIARPAITVAVTIQPEVVRSLADHREFRGRGLLARFLFVLPRSRVGGREITPAPLRREVQGRYRDCILAIARNLAVVEDVIWLELTPRADELLTQFRRELEPKLGDLGELGHIADWANKLPGACARIAGLLHLAERFDNGWSVPISEDSMSAALAIGRYLITHALAAFDAMAADPNLAAARHVLAWVRAGRLEVFSRRDCYQALRSRFRRVEELDPSLGVLQRHNYLREREAPETSGPGRRRSPIFEVNPLTHNSQNPQKPNSEDSGVYERGEQPA